MHKKARRNPSGHECRSLCDLPFSASAKKSGNSKAKNSHCCRLGNSDEIVSTVRKVELELVQSVGHGS